MSIARYAVARAGWSCTPCPAPTIGAGACPAGAGTMSIARYAEAKVECTGWEGADVTLGRVTGIAERSGTGETQVAGADTAVAGAFAGAD